MGKIEEKRRASESLKSPPEETLSNRLKKKRGAGNQQAFYGKSSLVQGNAGRMEKKKLRRGVKNGYAYWERSSGGMLLRKAQIIRERGLFSQGERRSLKKLGRRGERGKRTSQD